jgi:hypothetical protein
MREAGELLRSVGEADDRMLISRRLLDVAHRLDQLRLQATDMAAEPVSDEPPGEPVPIESLAYDSDAAVGSDDGIVPIESLAPDAAPTEQRTGLELTFTTFHRLLREQSTVSPSLNGLLRRGAPPTPAEEPAVPIDTLCYRGQAALERAVVVRERIAAELRRQPSLESLQPLLQELLDLVPLALAET